MTPGFGIDQENFEIYTRSRLIDYGRNYQSIMGMIDKMGLLTLNGSKQLNSLLLFGPQGTGKSSIATHYAKSSKFTYVKIIAPERYIGVGTYGRIASMTKIFNDAYKAK